MNTQNIFPLLRAFNAIAKKTWIFLILLFSYSNIQAQGPTFTITPSVTSPVPPGTTITFDVTVENYINIIANQFAISWDPSILNFVSIDNPNAIDFPTLTNSNFGITSVSSGTFHLSWLEGSLSPVTLADGIRMFSFTMISLTSGISTVQIDPNPFARRDKSRRTNDRSARARVKSG